MRLIKYSLFILLLLPVTMKGQVWPVDSSANSPNFDKISCSFAEKHSQIHAGIDIDMDMINCPILAAESGKVLSVSYSNSSVEWVVVIEHEYPQGTGNKYHKTKYAHLGSLNNISAGTIVNAGDVIGYVRRSVVGDHLHFEMHQYDNNQWFYLNPFKNDFGYEVQIPTDSYDPVINDVILKAFNQPSNVASGYIYDPASAPSISGFHEGSIKVHFHDRSGSTGTAYQNSHPLTVYGSIVPIAHVKDTAINSIPRAGAGMTVKYLEYEINGNDKYIIDFDRISEYDQGLEDEIFHFTFNYAAGQSIYYGNYDYIDLYDDNGVYIFPFKEIMDSQSGNYVRSNGVWATKAHHSTPELFATTPAQTARIVDEARYKDGKHTLTFTAEDASGRSTTEGINLVVDNFKPYIKNRRVSVAGHMHEGSWNWDEANGKLKYASNGVEVYTYYQGVYIELTASEPMSDMELNVYRIGNVEPYDTTNDYKTWHFFVEGNKILNLFNSGYSGYMKLIISGQDLNGTQLMSISSTNDIPASQIPYRTASGWSSKKKEREGQDDISHFYIGNSIPNAGVHADFSYSQGSEPPHADVLFSDKSTGEIAEWQWSFPGGNPSSSTYQEPVVSYPLAGSYQASLSIIDSSGNQSQISKNVLISEQFNGNISIEPKVWEWAELEYEFSVGVSGINPTDHVDIVAYFGDGSYASLDNNLPLIHEYAEPMSPTTLSPYAEVEVTDEFGNLTRRETVHFGNITLSPAFYDLDISINTLVYVNFIPRYGRLTVEPGQGVIFTASVPNAAGKVKWYWFVNHNPNDLQKCNCNYAGGCHCSVQTTTDNQGTYACSFEKEGQYLIWVDAQDQMGHQGSASIVITVREPDDPCVNSHLANACIGQYYFPLDVPKIMFDYTAAAMPQTSSCQYDDIFSLEFFKDGASVGYREYDHEYEYHQDPGYYCFDGFDQPGIYELRMKAQGGYFGANDPNTGTHWQTGSGNFKVEKTNIEVVDCDANLTINTQEQLNGYSGNINGGIINFKPEGALNLDSGDTLAVRAWKKVRLLPGTHLANGSYFKTNVIGCPVVPDWCSCWSDEELGRPVAAIYPEQIYSMESKHTIRLFPNPAHSKIFIETEKFEEINFISIVNLEGKLLIPHVEIMKKKTTVDISHLPAGLYFAKIYSYEGVAVEKIVIE